MLELRANSASFHQEMGRARDTLGQTGRSFSSAEHSAAQFAAKGFGAIVPAAEGFETSIHRSIAAALRAGSAFRLLGGAAIGVGAGFLAVKGVEKAAEFLALGESVTAFTERMKKAAEEQQKFFDKLGAGIKANVTLARERAVALGQASVLGLESTGDTEGAIRRRREVGIANIEAEAADRKAAALKDAVDQKITAEALGQQLVEIARTAAAKRVQVTAEAGKAFADLDRQRLESEKASFLAGTTALLDSLQKRIEARKKIEDSTRGLVEGGQIIDPLADTEKIKKDAEARAEGFAFLLNEGRPWRDLEQQIFSLDQQFADKGFSGFAQAVETARGKIKILGIDNKSILEDFTSVGTSISTLPNAVNAADPALIALNQRFLDLRTNAINAASAIQFLETTITSRSGPPAPIVGAPVDLGVQP